MMGDDIDSILNEEEKRIEVEELKEERERAGRRKGKTLRSAPLGMDDDMELGGLEPAELEHIDHHDDAEKEGRIIEEKLTLPISAATGKKKIPGTPSVLGTPPVKRQLRASEAKMKGTSSTKKQKEYYSKE